MKVSPIVTKNKPRVSGFGIAFALAQGLCLASSIVSLSNSAALAQDAYTPGYTSTGSGNSTGSSATAASNQSSPSPNAPATAPLVRPVTEPSSSSVNSSGSSLPPALRPPLPTLDKSLQAQDSVVDNGNLTAPINTPTSNTTGLPTGALSLPLDASGLTAKERQGDYDVVNTQADEFRKRFLQGEAIELRLPMGDQLMSLGAKLPPIRLEASYTQPISLREVVQYSLDNTLDIRIQREVVTQNKWILGNSLGKFLPDALMSYNSQYQAGTSLIGGIIPVSFGNPFATATAGFRYYGFRGGSVMFGSLANMHNYSAAKQGLRASINDTLLNVTRLYYNLVQNQALLQIQTRAVEVSKAQVLLNQQLERAGTGTRFQVLQSETQLARDEQALLTQEVDLRRTAIDLATALNLNSAVNLLSVESEVRKVRLVDPSIDVNQLINLAILNRPELKQYEQLRMAAKRNIQVQAAPLYPQFQFFGGYSGNGQTLTNQYGRSVPSFSVVPIQGAGFTAQTITTSGTTGVVSAPQTVYPVAAVYNPSQIIDRSLRKSYQIGMRVDWNFLGMGVPDMANIQAARAVARQATLRVNQQVIAVLQQVRTSYLTSLTAEKQIEVATKEVLSSAEELRLSRVRLANGVGTNIDVINAQRDFTQALVRKAQAIVAFNIQQAQLLRDVGVISYDTITSGRLAR
ncbi:MAG: TolC family protein [Candidatus Melainabacteria bacterium]|nr:TolC family protein [Candidatus Melainabacteria bacterium]